MALFVLASLSCSSTVRAQQADSTALQLDPVPVTATPITSPLPRIARHLQVVDSVQLHGAARPEAGEVLRTATLVDVRQRGPLDVQTDLSIRGGTFDQALVLLDGIPLNSAQTGHLSMDLPLATYGVERVEVLYGGASRTFGSGAFSGAINLITAPPRDGRGSLGLEAGEHGLWKVQARQDLRLKRLGLRLGAFSDHSQGYVPGTDFDRTGAHVEAADTSGKVHARLQAAYAQKRYGAFNFYSFSFPDQQETVGNGLASLHIHMGEQAIQWLNSTAATDIRIHYRQVDDQFELFREDDGHYHYANGYFIRNETDTAKLGPSAYYIFHNRHRTRTMGVVLSETLRSAWGTTVVSADWRQERIFSNVLGEPVQNARTLRGSREVLDRSAVRNIRNYALSHRREQGPWVLDGGALLDLTDDFKPQWAYGLDVVRRWRDAQQTYVNVGTSFRHPTWTDLYYNRGGTVGSKDLQPEHALQLELGHRLYREHWNLKLALWRRNGRNLIDWILMPGDSVTRASNLTRVNLNGVELEWNVQAGKARGGLLYAYQWADQTGFPYISLYVLDHLAHNAVLWWHQPLPKGFGLHVNLTWKRRVGNYRDLEGGALLPYPDPLRADLRAQWKHRRATIFASAYNLLDSEQMDRGNVPLPGRWISVGVQVEWDVGPRTRPKD